MPDVREFPTSPGSYTRVWITQAAIDAIAARPDAKKLILKLKHRAGPGLHKFEPEIVRHEWGGVYRIGERNDLFRILGFYDADDKRSFVIIATMTKHGKSLRNTEKAVIDAVAAVKKNGDWRKVVPDGDYPRLATDR